MPMLLALGGWLGPGGLPGLQNRWRVALRAAVGSTPIHSRLLLLKLSHRMGIMLPVESDSYTPIVGRFLRVEDTTWGDEKKGFFVRYRGELYSQDSAQA